MVTLLDGSCRCGSVRYRITGDPVLVCGCCCQDCAHFTGTPYTVWVGVLPAMIDFSGSRPVVRATSPITERGHCGTCGTPLTFRRINAEAERDPLFYVTAGSLEDPDAVQPSEVIYYAERPLWFELQADIPRHPGPSPEYGTAVRHGKPH